MNFLIHDELRLDFEFDIQIRDERLIADFSRLELSMHGEPEKRTTPIYNDIGISEEEYENFWANLD